jgi:nicotinamide mononucleotide (NMN) deamidase PncC
MSTRFPFFHPRRDQQKQIPPQNGNSDIIEAAQREILRQARRSHNLHEIGVAASLVFGIVTGGLALAEQIPAAGVTAITGAGFITYSSQMNKDAQEKLEDLLKRLQERKG